MRSFSFGVLVTSSLGDDGINPLALLPLARRVAVLGADALFVTTSTTNAIEPVTALAAIARSSDLVLGAVVPLESRRNPAIVTKLATTLTLLAPGRTALVFTSDRVEASLRLREALEVAAALRGEGPIRAGGAEFFVKDAYNEPRPARGDELGIAAIVDQPGVELAAVCDFVITRGARDGAEKEVLLVNEAELGRMDRTPVVVEVDGGDVDHVVDVVARAISLWGAR